MSPLPQQPRACEHLDRPIVALGRCINCYNQHYVEQNRPRVREQKREAQARYRAADPEKYREANRREWLWAKYGLTLEDYDTLVASQQGRCAVCLEVLASGRDVHVDHDHASGRIRGVQCRRCNRALGLLHDDIDVLRSAAAYLARTAFAYDDVEGEG